MDIIKKIIFNFNNNKSLYIGEKITMTEHMIQSAMLAEKNKSSTLMMGPMEVFLMLEYLILYCPLE